MRLCAYDFARDKRAFIASVVSKKDDDSWKEKAVSMAGSMPIPAIAKEVGKTYHQVARVFKVRGIKPGRFCRYTASDLRMVVRLTNMGLQKGEIARRLDITGAEVDTVRRIAKRKGML